MHKAFIEFSILFACNFMRLQLQLPFIAIYMDIELNLAIKADKKLLK